MVRKAKAPSGFYSATEAIKLLGMPKSSFYDLVEKGKIKKVVPPGRSDGYYPKSEIDKLVRARELFILEYTQEPSTFQKAEEGDIRGLYEVCKTLWGNMGTPSYETRLAWYRKNPEMYYVVKQDGIVVGFVALIPIKEEKLKEMMDHPGLNEETEDILSFEPGKTIHGIFLEIGVRSDIPKNRKYGRQLIEGAFKILDVLSEKCVIIEKAYAHSRAPDGISLCRKLGFKEKPPIEGDTRIRFEIELGKSDHPLLKNYRKNIERCKDASTIKSGRPVGY
jgi:predicted DNA-binding transcriptional regulator AlpA